MNECWRKQWLTLLWISLGLCAFVTSTDGQSCMQYYSPSAPSLHCMDAFTSCDYVTTPQSLSLATTESEVDIVFNQARIGIEAGDITELCFGRFSVLYCHQAFSMCRKEYITVQTGDGSERSMSHYVSVNSSLCVDDCESVIGGDCSEQHWDYLTNIVDQFRSIGSIQLPALQQRSDCNSSLAHTSSENCTSLNTGPLPTESCAPTQPPTTTEPPTDSNLPDTTLIAAICLGVGIPIVLLSVLVFIVIFCVCQVRKPKQRDSTPQYRMEDKNGSVNPLEDAGIEFKFDAPDSQAPKQDPEAAKRGTLMMRQSAFKNALFVNTSPRSHTLVKRLASKEYLKMTPKQRLQALDFPHSNICLLKDLWETNFGMTYQGEATGLEENVVSTTIFIKSLKERASSKVQQQFMIEMTWASGFNHPNVIALLGVCREEPLFMIYEYLEYGSLKEFLQSLNSAWFDFDEVLNETASTCHSISTSTSPLSLDDLCSISHQVADGMDYLSKKAFILKDLAARNCQVGQGLTVKISNFGLSYDHQSKDYCHLSSTKSAPLPLRWLAPEVVRHSKFSVYSDIWSYGVVLWEVFTFGAQPYDKLSNAQVAQSILNGHFLPQPDRCPESVYALMLKCWLKQPSKRPWFSVISKELTDLTQNISIEEKRAFGGLSTPDLASLRRPVSSATYSY